MILKTKFLWFLFFLLAVANLQPNLFAQVSPDESLKSLRATEGIGVSLWAAEPMVNNPTAIDIDSRGRVWIAEGMNYRMKLRQLDHMGRVEGADRIKVLEDTDNDGKADKVTVFAENIFPVPLGLAVEEIWKNGKLVTTRVYVGNSPDLLVLEDTDGDDVADVRFPLLTGFRGIDSDHGLHGMTLGLDGKLYFTVGDTRYGADNVQGHATTFDVTDKSGRRVSADNYGTTLRVNRDGTEFEVLTSGHRNNYEATVDSFGNVFGSDNDDDGKRGCRMYWAVDGGRYGYQNPDSTRHWGEELPGMIPKLVGTGNGSPAGIFIYEGNGLPKKYFGAVLQIDAATRQINSHPLVRHGSAFRSEYDVLLKGEDDWFRPIDLAAAPDGSLFICDWYDAGVGGNRFSDQTTGRIYRLTGNNAQETIGAEALAKEPLQGLMSPNKTTQLAARDALIAQGSKVRSSLQQLVAHGEPYQRARALHVLHAIPETGEQDTLTALRNDNSQVREMALQLLIRDLSQEYLVSSANEEASVPPALKHLSTILPLADDPDPGVRRVLLLGLRRVPTEQAAQALIQLALSWDGQDRYYLEAIRSAVATRSSEFVASLFEQLSKRAQDERSAGGNSEGPIASPPYYPTSSNDAFLSVGDELAPSNALSKLLGIAWVLQRRESLSAIRAELVDNTSSHVELVAAEAVASIPDKEAATFFLERLTSSHLTPETKRQMLPKLGDKIPKEWSELREDQALKEVLASLWQSPGLRQEVSQLVGKGALSYFAPNLHELAKDQEALAEERTAALLALGALRDASVGPLASHLIQQVEGQRSGGEVALAALETLRGIQQGAELTKIFENKGMPLDVRRRALQLLVGQFAGVEQVLKRRETHPLEESFESELRFLLHNHSDPRARNLAHKNFPIDPNAANKLHDYQVLMGLGGDAKRGRELFTNNSSALCARCHRIDGGGTLVGPDLSTIGTKYGPREMLYHIQNPSGAINYNFSAQSFLLEDGTVASGLVLKRDAGVITLGLANGEQVKIEEKEIEEEKQMSASIMPEGLLASLTPQQVADLLEFLATLTVERNSFR